jgi:hypothetical protein
VSISKLTAEAAAAAAAAAAAGSSSVAKLGKKGSAAAAGTQTKSSGKSHKKKQKPRGPYVLPQDEVSGSWRLVADDIVGVQALGEALSASKRAADVEVGQLLLQQVVATLLERKQQEEKVRGWGGGPTVHKVFGVGLTVCSQVT